MKVRTIEKLQDKLQEEMSWRRREIIQMRMRARLAPKDLTSLRAGYLLLYSSWEGYIRSAANLYVIFVFGRNVAVSKLVEGLQAVYFQQQFSAAQNSKTMVSLKDFFYEVRRQEILTPHRKYVDKREKRFINTASNLNSKRLNDILQLLELPTERFLLKENWVDTNLLRIRNEIAHGERISVSQVEFENTAVRVTKMMDDFSNVVLSAAESREFLKSTRLNRRAV